jgi:hypothetical protein
MRWTSSRLPGFAVCLTKSAFFAMIFLLKLRGLRPF